MKEIKFFLIFAAFIMLLNMVSSLSLDIDQEYNGLETAIVKINGNIIDQIRADQIEFKRINVLMPFEYDVKRINGDYYIWFVTPRVENVTNFTLILNDIIVQELGQNKKVTFMQNFSVDTNITRYYIKPGFIFTKDNYIIQIISNIDSTQKINVDFPQKREIEILAGKNDIEFESNGIDSTIFKLAKIGDYMVPIYIQKEGDIEVILNNGISISPSSLRLEKEIDSGELEYHFKITNIGGNLIEDLYIEYDDRMISVVPEDKIDLNPGEEVSYNITLERELNVSEIIKIYSKKNNISKEFLFEINFTDSTQKINYTLINETVQNNMTGRYYCQEIGGVVCLESQNCSGQILKTKENATCCIGKCSLIKEKKENNSWIGYLIITLALIGIVYGYIRYKQVKPSKTFLEKTIEENKIKSNIP